LVKEQGGDTLIDVKKCKAYLADYANNEYKKERHLLLIAIEVGAGKAIANTNELEICKKQQIRYLKEDRFIDETAATEAVDLLAFALRGDRNKSITVANNVNSQSPYNPPSQRSSYATQSQTIPIDAQPAPKKKSAIGKFFLITAALVVISLAGWFFVNEYQRQNVENILERATIAYDNKNYKEAIALYDQVIALDPNNARAYNNRGIAYANLSNYEKAITDYTEAIKLDPNYAEAYNNRGDAYYYLNNYKQAIADYTQAIKIDPNYAEAYLYRADAYDNSGEKSKAIADLTQAIKIDPIHAEDYHYRGIAYKRLRDHNKAIADFTQAIKLDPNYAEAYHSRGIAYFDSGETSKAIADVTQVIKIKPKDGLAYFNRGVAYANLGYFSKAIADYTQAIKIDPRFEDDFFKSRIVYSSMGSYFDDPGKAIVGYTQQIERDTKNAPAYSYFERGQAYSYLGDYSKAIADYTQAIKMDPDYYAADAYTYMYRAAAYDMLGDYKSATKDARKACELGYCSVLEYLGKHNILRD
jgi:tetratricopeptide (TPR) repeat protein